MLDIPAFCEEQKINQTDFLRITHFSDEKLATFLSDGLISYDNKVLSITETGSFFIRNIAVQFDPDYQQVENKYSKSV